MDEVVRYDDAELRIDAAEETPEGWLRVPAVIGRTGVLEYQDASGKVTREYRPPDEVFAPDSIRSFELRPVTNDHPPVRLDSSNARIYSVGHNGEIVKRDGDKLTSTILVTDIDAIKAVRAGKRQLSPGYTVQLDPTPGVAPDGSRYDAVQRVIRGNHVALVDRGRQGPAVSLRMDSGDALATTLASKRSPMEPDENEDRGDAKAKITIDDTEYEVPGPVARAFKKNAKELAGFKKKAGKGAEKKDGEDEPTRSDSGEMAKLEARLDALEAENKKLREDADARLDARVDLGTHAREILGPDYKLTGKSDVEIQRDVILKVDPSAKDKLDARKDDAGYVAARYEIAVEQHAKSKDSGARILELARSASTPKTDAAHPADPVAKAKAEAEKRRADAWKPKTAD